MSNIKTKHPKLTDGTIYPTSNSTVVWSGNGTTSTTDATSIFHPEYGSDAPSRSFNVSAAIEREKDHMEHMKQAIERSKALITAVESLEFDYGDIVYHKDYGVCVVQRVKINNYYDSPDRHIEVRIATKDGVEQVPSSEIIVRTETSKALYE